MNQNTQIETELQVTRDGSPDADYIRKQKIRKAIAKSMSLTQALGQVIANELHEIATPIYLDVVDARYGSHLRREYFDRKQAKAIASIRQQYLA